MKNDQFLRCYLIINHFVTTECRLTDNKFGLKALGTI